MRIDPRFIILLSTLTLTPRQYFSVLRLLPYVPIVYPFSFLSLSYISINFECGACFLRDKCRHSVARTRFGPGLRHKLSLEGIYFALTERSLDGCELLGLHGHTA